VYVDVDIAPENIPQAESIMRKVTAFLEPKIMHSEN